MKYSAPEIEALELDMVDVIATSSGEPIPDENEGPILTREIPTV